MKKLIFTFILVLGATVTFYAQGRASSDPSKQAEEQLSPQQPEMMKQMNKHAKEQGDMSKQVPGQTGSQIRREGQMGSQQIEMRKQMRKYMQEQLSTSEQMRVQTGSQTGEQINPQQLDMMKHMQLKMQKQMQDQLKPQNQMKEQTSPQKIPAKK